MFLLLVVLLLQADPSVAKFGVKVVEKVYASKEECAKAGQAIGAAAEHDPQVADILLGVCIPTDAQTASK